MKLNNSKYIYSSLFLMSVLLTACGGSSTSASGTAAGQRSVITATRGAAPITSCANGGITVEAGIDTNSNGVLDAAEVTSTQYVCNGAAGTNGANAANGLGALVSVTTEPAGANCASGGKKVSVGLDSNGNGILDTAEITSSDYVCNGANGTSGSTGPAGPGVTWVNVTGTAVQAIANTGYLANNAAQVAITLPAAPAIGDVVQVTGVGAGGWKVAQNAGQSIIFQGATGALWTPRETARSWQSVASSADGTKLVAVVRGGQIYTSANSGVTWALQAGSVVATWYSVASSSDGSKLVAAVWNGQLYTSTNAGVDWFSRASARSWQSVASSADGSKLIAAVAYGGQLYTSIDSGGNWTVNISSVSGNWISVASSADGSKLVAADNGGYLYTSADAGASWSPHENPRNWYSVASSSDGSKLVAADLGGQLYTSTDSGATWGARESARSWIAVASSADGSKLVAADKGGQLYTSADSGVTWTARETARNWDSVAASADGSKLVAAVYGGQLFTSIPSTTAGITGSISGAQYESVDLQCVDTNIFVVRGFVGSLVVQ